MGHGGAQAPLPATLPSGVSVARLHQISAAGYVSGIHRAFLVGAIVLYITGVLAAVLLRPVVSPAGQPGDEVAPDPVARKPVVVGRG